MLKIFLISFLPTVLFAKVPTLSKGESQIYCVKSVNQFALDGVAGSKKTIDMLNLELKGSVYKTSSPFISEARSINNAEYEQMACVTLTNE
jgi:hypothetical protein